MIDISELREHSAILDKPADFTVQLQGYEQAQPTIEFTRCTLPKGTVKTKVGFAVVWRDETDEYAISFDMERLQMLLYSGSGEHFKFKETDGIMKRVDISGGDGSKMFFYYTRAGLLARDENG